MGNFSYYYPETAGTPGPVPADQRIRVLFATEQMAATFAEPG